MKKSKTAPSAAPHGLTAGGAEPECDCRQSPKCFQVGQNPGYGFQAACCVADEQLHLKDNYFVKVSSLHVSLRLDEDAWHEPLRGVRRVLQVQGPYHVYTGAAGKVHGHDRQQY